MAESLRSWIISIICAAMFCGIVISITPKGRVHSAVKLLCGIVMIFSILSPITKLNFSEYSENLAKYKERAAELAESADDYNDKLSRTFIEDKCAAYILDKAESCGAELNSVAVSAEWSMDGYWYPNTAEIVCSCSDELTRRLSSWIEAELGITKERQVWTYG